MNLYELHTKPETLLNFDKRLKVPKFAFDYVRGGGKATPEIESAIAKDAHYAYKYAHDVLKSRFPEGESAIAKYVGTSYLYATFVLKSRFPEGESVIATNADRAYNYSMHVLKSRFPEGEAAIAKDGIYWRRYKEYFGL